MVKGEVIKPRDTIIVQKLNYRALKALNVSMIKLFDSDPVKFYEQFKLGKGRKDEKTTSLIIGDLVDFYLLDCGGNEEEFNNRFEEKFALYDGVKGSGQVFLLADVLFKVTQGYINEDGEITASFDTRFTEAFQKIQGMKKYVGGTEDKALKDFNDNAYTYFETLMENCNKTVVDVSLLDKAKKIADILMTDEFTQDVFSDEDDNIEYFPKFAIEWVWSTQKGKKIDCKSEVDSLKIDHNKKVIYLRDLKTTYDNEGFEFSYIKHGYYLQAGFYYMAVEYWAEQEGMKDYTILPMEFVVGDTSSNNRRPIRYQTDRNDLYKSLHGFTLRGTYHKGLIQLIEEISWSEDKNIWNASKNLIDNKGILKLELNYD